ncbi:phosphoenolpyruvate carboxykinase (ATP) [bacterium]|nr:phosphoenolpyruvate carboxykinase (ATP) [bacterium]
MKLKNDLGQVLSRHKGVILNPDREMVINRVVRNREAITARQGFLYTFTLPESTGRSPKDTMIVRNPESDPYIDWDSPYNLSLDPETFGMLWQDALDQLKRKKNIYVTERVLGADPAYAMPVRTVTDSSLTALFTLNMFRPIPADIAGSIFAEKQFLLLVLPYDKIETSRYRDRLRHLPGGKTSDLAIVMDFANHLGLVYGSAYGGSVKKLMFTVMNYNLPFSDILPLHCSANEDSQGRLSLFLGLSGTGKTSLSADATRSLLGDDEHGWSGTGVANFEYGCYAKLINLDPGKEPEIFDAVFHRDKVTRHGAIVENAMIYPDSSFDLSDERLTPNSRASYPLSFLKNIKQSARGSHPRNILFLTADANGVLPPVACLSRDQAMFWFLMGYTSKLAGTETGVVDPVSIFSRFFGEPFMPLLPEMYAELLGKKLDEHQTRCFLINTGWTGGPFGVGRRIDIGLTRSIVNAVLNGDLDEVAVSEDQHFFFKVPKSCPGISPTFLVPRETWADDGQYNARARKLAFEFYHAFDKAYGNKKIAKTLMDQCPGRSTIPA